VCDAGLAASANVVGVSLGGILGHCMCTGGAVLGGRQMAAYVAERTLAVIIFSKALCSDLVWRSFNGLIGLAWV